MKTMSGQQLLERDGERAQLAWALDGACAGRGCVVTAEGEAGLGKSALLALGAELAGERGMRVLGATGGVLEQDVAWGVVRQLLEPLVLGPERVDGLLDGPARAAAPVFDADGWAHTGDVGEFDAEGRLTLDGRRDERFATAFGTNIDPARIETALRAECPSIAQACVIGDGRPYLVALITIEADVDAVAAAVERVNAQYPETGRIRRYAVLEDTWAPGSDELTPTLKLRRSAVQARYADHIEALYAEG